MFVKEILQIHFKQLEYLEYQVFFSENSFIRDASWHCSSLKCQWFLKYLDQKNVIVLFGNGRTTALKWRKSRMHRMKMKYFTDQNVILLKNWNVFVKITLDIQAVWNVCCNIFSTNVFVDYQKCQSDLSVPLYRS